MQKQGLTLLIGIVFLAATGAALAQNANMNTAGPTKNDLKMHITEPVEGATITGSSVRVAVDYDRTPYREQGQSVKGLSKFPPPTFDVLVDNELKQSLTGGNNIATIENTRPGAHKIVVLAKNLSGEVIDRKEVGFTTVSATAAMTTSTTTERTTGEVAAPPPAPAPAPAPEAAPAPAPPAPAETTMPQTASNAPRLALAGLLLVAAGAVLARKVR